jgi:hypothetical protein
MPIPSHLKIKSEGVDFDALLSDWRWLVKPELKPFLLTVFGDLFLRGESGRIYFLNAMTGSLKEVADSEEAFEQLCEDREQRRMLFLSSFLMEVRQIRGELAPGDCYSCEVPLSLGGELEPENFETSDLSSHFSILGQLHSQTKDLPAGTKIDKINIVPPNEDPKPKSLWQRMLGR